MYQEALTCYEFVLISEPENLDVLQRKGLCLEKLGRDEEALQCYDQVLNYSPDNSEAWYSKGCLLNKTGNYDAAIVCYDKALNPDSGIELEEMGNEPARKIDCLRIHTPLLPRNP